MRLQASIPNLQHLVNVFKQQLVQYAWFEDSVSAWQNAHVQPQDQAKQEAPTFQADSLVKAASNLAIALADTRLCGWDCPLPRILARTTGDCPGPAPAACDETVLAKLPCLHLQPSESTFDIHQLLPQTFLTLRGVLLTPQALDLLDPYNLFKNHLDSSLQSYRTAVMRYRLFRMRHMCGQLQALYKRRIGAPGGLKSKRKAAKKRSIPVAEHFAAAQLRAESNQALASTSKRHQPHPPMISALKTSSAPPTDSALSLGSSATNGNPHALAIAAAAPPAVASPTSASSAGNGGVQASKSLAAPVTAPSLASSADIVNAPASSAMAVPASQSLAVPASKPLAVPAPEPAPTAPQPLTGAALSPFTPAAPTASSSPPTTASQPLHNARPPSSTNPSATPEAVCTITPGAQPLKLPSPAPADQLSDADARSFELSPSRHHCKVLVNAAWHLGRFHLLTKTPLVELLRDPEADSLWGPEAPCLANPERPLRSLMDVLPGDFARATNLQIDASLVDVFDALKRSGALRHDFVLEIK